MAEPINFTWSDCAEIFSMYLFGSPLKMKNSGGLVPWSHNFVIWPLIDLKLLQHRLRIDKSTQIRNMSSLVENPSERFDLMTCKMAKTGAHLKNEILQHYRLIYLNTVDETATRDSNIVYACVEPVRCIFQASKNVWLTKKQRRKRREKQLQVPWMSSEIWKGLQSTSSKKIHATSTNTLQSPQYSISNQISVFIYNKLLFDVGFSSYDAIKQRSGSRKPALSLHLRI